MKALLQRVKKSSVRVNSKIVGQIENGFMILFGVEEGDDKSKAEYLASKIANLRVFDDENGKMNLSILDVKGEILVVSQFTLLADISKGNRPSFIKAAKPDMANEMYEFFVGLLRQKGIKVETGVFQAVMEVEIINDGPVTFMLER